MEQESEVETTPLFLEELSAIICNASSASLAATAIRSRRCWSNRSESEVSFWLSLMEALALRNLDGCLGNDEVGKKIRG